MPSKTEKLQDENLDEVFADHFLKTYCEMVSTLQKEEEYNTPFSSRELSLILMGFLNGIGYISPEFNSSIALAIKKIGSDFRMVSMG